jgi:hypothetical protein
MHLGLLLEPLRVSELLALTVNSFQLSLFRKTGLRDCSASQGGILVLLMVMMVLVFSGIMPAVRVAPAHTHTIALIIIVELAELLFLGTAGYCRVNPSVIAELIKVVIYKHDRCMEQEECTGRGERTL